MSYEITVMCDYCAQPAELATGAAVYPHRPELAHLFFWECVPCAAYVGCHKQSPKHEPMGRLANSDLRNWKRRAHEAFDPRWRDGKEFRGKSYKWLADKLGITVDDCHIGEFDVDLCQKVVEACDGT